MPVQPNIARVAGVSATLTSIPSAARTIIPASSTADRVPAVLATSGQARRSMVQHFVRCQDNSPGPG